MTSVVYVSIANSRLAAEIFNVVTTEFQIVMQKYTIGII